MTDSKFHDIPETVRLSVREATLSGSSLITVHGSGGLKMIQAAVVGAQEGREQTTNVFKRSSINKIGGVLAITVLTSLDGEDCRSIFGYEYDSEDAKEAKLRKVKQLAYFALDAGATGIVCSAEEVEVLASNRNFDPLLKVVPGITPLHAKKADDQKATGTPRDAINRGADLLVVGRGINQASSYGLSKLEASKAISSDIAEALSGRSQ